MDVYERSGLYDANHIDDGITLDHIERDKGRLKITSDKGECVRLFLVRGQTLQIGEVLTSQCGKHIQINAADEAVMTASTDDWLVFSKACYHLGNRHVKIQVGERWLRIKPDHVLEELLTELGLLVKEEATVFMPESGAYAHRSHDKHKHHHEKHGEGHHDHHH